MELQETRMSKDEKDGGSDLDIFEGLGKKGAKAAAPPPPPPGSAASDPSVNAAARSMRVDAKRTLLGIPGPATLPTELRGKAQAPSGAASTTSSRPPPLPRRASLPDIQATSGAVSTTAESGGSTPPSQTTPSVPAGSRPAIRKATTHPPSNSAARAATVATSPPVAAVAPGTTARPNGKANLDWDDEEATTVFKEEDRKKAASGAPPADKAAAAEQNEESGQQLQSVAPSPEPERASMDAILSEPPRHAQVPTNSPAGATPAPDADVAPITVQEPAVIADSAPITVQELATVVTSTSAAETDAPPAPALVATPAAESPRPDVTSPLDTLGSRSAPPAPEPGATSLSGAFPSLAQKPGSLSPPGLPPAARVRLAPPPMSRGPRSTTPPPPHVGPPRTPGASAAPPPRPPPPPGQVTTAPMHMPERPRDDGWGPQGTAPFKQEQMPSTAPPSLARGLEGGNPAGGLTSHPPVMPLAYPSIPPAVSAYPARHAPAHPSPSRASNLPPVGRTMEQTMRTRPSSKTPLIASIVGAVVAIAAGVFFLMPRSGTLVVNVADAKGGVVNHLEILVDGAKRCESAPCIVHDVSSGIHEVKVAAKGFESPAPRALTFDGRPVQTDFQLLPAKGAAGTGFKVAAPQPGLRLQVDGKDVGPLPQEVRDLEPGEHKLHFTGDRYQPLDKTITVAKDEMVELGNVNLRVTKGKATIQLTTAGAKVVLVNGPTRKEVPTFPIAIEFDPSEKWELSATKDGFDEFKERVVFDDGQAEKTFTITLTPKSAAVGAVPAAPSATAAVVAAPTAPTAPREPATVPKAAPKDVKPAAEPAASEPETLLKINSLPASSIVLDGKPIGVTPQPHVVVTPGPHTITFVNAEQSLKKTINVDVKAGEAKAAFAKLRDD